MPDHVAQTYNESKAKGQESVNPYQSAWMARWIQRSCNSAVSPSESHGHFAVNDSKEENCETKLRPMLVEDVDSWPTESDIYAHPGNISEKEITLNCQQGELVVASCALDSAKVVGARIAENRAETTNDTLAITSRNKRNERPGRNPFSMFVFKKKIDGTLPSEKNLTVCSRLASRFQISESSGRGTATVGTSGPKSPPILLRLGPSEIEFSSKNSQHQLDNIPLSAIQWSNPDESFENKSLPLSIQFRDNLMRLTSDRMPYGIAGRIPVHSRNKESEQSSLHATLRERLVDANLTRLDQELCNYQSYSKFLVCNEEMDNQLIARNSGKTSESLHLMQNDGAQQLHYPSVTNGQFPVSVGEQGKLIHHSSVDGFPQGNTIPLVTKLNELNNECQFQHRLPTHTVHDVETLRICATVDSREAVPGGPSKVSLTTHQLLITKKSGLNLLPEDEMIKKSKRPSNSKGSALHELVRLPIDFYSHAKQGRKLQTVGNSSDSAGEAEVFSVETESFRLKSESSAETDTMDIDDCQAQDTLLCFAASPSTKDFKVNQNSAKSQATVLMMDETSQRCLKKTKLCDINQDPSPLLAGESSMENKGLSTSRTESLDVEHLSYAKQPVNLNTSQQDAPLGETSNIWVKRLKLSSSDSLPHDTGSSKMGNKSSSSENENKFVKSLHYDSISSGPLWTKHVSKGKMEMDEKLDLERNRKSSSTDLVVKEFRNQTLSHPWIRRWCRNQAVSSKSKPTVAVICENQSLEASMDEFQRKKLPSIAAMALMGKATNCFQPCQFRKKGSVVVWNSDEFK